jgi:mono/diheme cytochrome c family protein
VRAVSLAAAVTILALALTGCGGGSKAPQHSTTTHQPIHLTALEERGKAIFISKCGICHQLADAGTTGTAGPALIPSWTARRVRLAIEQGPDEMQPNLVTGRDAAAVAAYVEAATW